MVQLGNFINIFSIAELRKKIAVTLAILVVYRLGIHIPVIGVDISALHQFMQQGSALGGIISYVDLFSGGMLSQCTIFALGVMPYITASIMMQVLSMTIPSLETLSKEGEYGRKIINQYTRYLTLAVSVVQSLGFVTLLKRLNLVLTPGIGFNLMFILTLTAGSLFVMWLGEQISLFGLGNGSSMIIFAGIVAHLPTDLIKTIYNIMQGYTNWIVALVLLGIFVAIAACIVFLEKGERRIPIQYTRRVVGQRVYGAQSSYIPFKINVPGVMPVIFASAVLNVPMFVIAMLSQRFELFKWLAESFVPTGLLWNACEFVLIIFFSFFYTALVYNADELAENIKKSGGSIPGIRPGRKTAEYINYILNRIGLVGAIYLAVLALAPNLLKMVVKYWNLAPELPLQLGGTSLLILIGVALDTAAQIESYLIEHRYEGFLTSGRMKMRGAR